MRNVLCISLLLALTAPLAAQAPPPGSENDQPAELPEALGDLFERMLRGFAEETAPHLRNLERQLQQIEPEIERFWDSLRGMAQYHPPEILPNGDILIRRRQPDDAPPSEDQAEPDAEPEALPFEL